MAIGDFVKRLGDDVASWWGDKLKGWMASWVMKGVEGTFDFFEPDMRSELIPSLRRLSEIPNLPDDIKAIFDKAMGEPKAIQLAFLFPMAIGMLLGAGLGMATPLMNLGAYQIDKRVTSARLDPLSVITAWRRDPAKYMGLFDDLKDQGWSDDRIEALKFYTLFYPSPRDLIGFLAHEVFEDDMAARYGLDMDFGEVAKHLDKFEKAGMKEPQVKELWRDHWEHASYIQMVEMLHRGLLTETGQPPPTTKEGWEARDAEGTKILRDWYKLVEIADFWRDKLAAMSWNMPTRVDVRRWWDMRTISEEDLRNIYHRQGYHGTDLDNYVLWTKVYTAFPDLIARMIKGWISPEDVGKELEKLGMPPDRVKEMMETKIKPEKPARTAAERDLTRADFIKGIKKGVISPAEGKELIMKMGYDEAETDFIIAVHVETEGGSPANFAEYNRLAQLWRYSQGLPTEMTPEQIAAAEKKLTERYPKKVPLTEEELKVKVDTIRRKRRARQLTRDEEIVALLALDLTVDLATAYADNDDLRLRAEKEGK